MSKRKWILAYVDALPSAYRLHELDSRYEDIATRASEKGWTAEALADAVSITVARKDRVISPAALAVRVASDLANGAPINLNPIAPDPDTADDWRAMLPAYCQHPNAVAQGLRPNQCWPCRLTAGDPLAIAKFAPDKPCDCGEPGCNRKALPRIPPEHVAARRALLGRLEHIPRDQMTEQARADAMAELIASQRVDSG